MTDSSVPWLDDDAQATWRAFLAVHDELSRHLERGLQRRSGLSRQDFAVLVQLSEAPSGTLRPGDLCRALSWEQSRTSHQLGRMERRGLVERRPCSEDGRGALVSITADGRDAIVAAAPGHVRDLRAVFVDVLGADDLDRLRDLSLTILDAIRRADGDDRSRPPRS